MNLAPFYMARALFCGTLSAHFYCLNERFAVCDLTRLRMMSTSCVQAARTYAREVSLPVPWGQIAGKAWGNPDGKPVLALHGWLDNAGSFDKLIPLLSKDLNVVAIDWPGHGHSSHRPKGSHYHAYDYIADIKYIVDALKWNKFMILAHSMGAGPATWFAGALPGRVEGLVLLEGFGFWAKPMTDLPELMGHALNSLSSLEEKDLKTYPSWDAAVGRMLEGHTRFDRDFTLEAAATLTIRGATQTQEGGYQFTRDLKAKAPSLLKVCLEVNDTFLEATKCPILVIIGDQASFPTTILNKWLEIRKIKLVKVEGGHHVHLYNPEVMDRLVEHFLLTTTIHPDYQELSKL